MEEAAQVPQLPEAQGDADHKGSDAVECHPLVRLLCTRSLVLLSGSNSLSWPRCRVSVVTQTPSILLVVSLLVLLPRALPLAVNKTCEEFHTVQVAHVLPTTEGIAAAHRSSCACAPYNLGIAAAHRSSCACAPHNQEG